MISLGLVSTLLTMPAKKVSELFPIYCGMLHRLGQLFAISGFFSSKYSQQKHFFKYFSFHMLVGSFCRELCFINKKGK